MVRASVGARHAVPLLSVQAWLERSTSLTLWTLPSALSRDVLYTAVVTLEEQLRGLRRGAPVRHLLAIDGRD